MIDQEAENVAASVRHLMIQRGIDAREWERQAKQWQSVADAQRKELEELRASATLAVERWKHSEAIRRSAVNEAMAMAEKSDKLQARITIAERMARYLGWAFEQKLIHPNETKELLMQVLHEWKAGVADVDNI